jgi:hypothetical protein
MKKIIMFVLPLLIAGCATMETVQSGKENGTVKVYDTSKDNAYSYAKKIIREIGGQISFEDEVKGEVFAQTGFEVGSYGSYIGVWIESISEKKVKVCVYTRRILATQIKTGISESDFHKKLKRYIDAE